MKMEMNEIIRILKLSDTNPPWEGQPKTIKGKFISFGLKFPVRIISAFRSGETCYVLAIVDSRDGYSEQSLLLPMHMIVDLVILY